MTELEMMEQIRKSAENVQIPEGLSPERVRERLAGLGGLAGKQDKEVTPAAEGRTGAKNRWYRSKAVTAAAVFLVCGIGISATCRLIGGPGAPFGGDAQMADRQNGISSGQTTVATEGHAGESYASDRAGEEDAVSERQSEPKHDAGDLYIVADNYSQVYDLLDRETYEQKYRTAGGITSDAVVEEAADETLIMDPVNNMSMEDGGVVMSPTPGASSADLGAVRKEEASDIQESAPEYSKTNVVTEGVDESDIIRTDGSYLYILHEDRVRIIDIRGENMKEAGEIGIAMDSASARVMEMYVNGDVLNLILEREETQLREEEGEEDVYYMDSDVVTELLTYEISDKSNPVLKGSVTQDGAYKTSRKIGDIVYVFSETYMGSPVMTRERALLDENTSGWIPVVNGRAIAADCIYLPEQGSGGLVIASVDVKEPEKTIDQTLIVNSYVEIYVSRESLYLYNSDYTGSGVSTQIAKFSLKEGVIDAAGAASAAGQVTDTFAIQEQNGALRLLTTDWSRAETENCLYLFDGDLKLTGSLKGIAKGEEIYAARFIGQTAYFVTYRNTDPLFAVDLSDEKNPKILSELKITGFSEYLHLWGNDRLFGIGYETDPDTGERKGIKLTMFDISDPADLEVEGTCIIGNIDYSPALYQYKCVLADPDQNLIGFAAESYGKREEYSYLLFSWEDGKFRELLTESLGGRNAPEDYRGIYVGDRFYLASPGEVMSYDREDGYRRTEKLTF